MLLLTDRMSESLRLQKALGQLGPCSLVALHQALDHPSPPSIIICDVALDNIVSFELLRAAVAHHRATSTIPVLCLTRDPSHLTHAQAGAIGATMILSSQLPLAVLVSKVRELVEGDAAGGVGSRDRAIGLQKTVEEAGSSLSDLMEAAKLRRAIPVSSVERGGDAVLLAIKQANIRVWLDVVWNYDDITYQHCLLVAGLTAAFSLKLGLSLQSQRLLSQAALIHDIGKAHIPFEILNKPGPLSMAEMAIMKNHAAIGHEILMAQPGFNAQLLDVVRHHHEYLDGSGYPDGLRGNQISHFVRVLTVCDIYAALIERRSYKAPMPPPRALSILVDMGPKLDRSLVDAFLKVVDSV